ncbi:hypothetical protein [Streptomyces griseofuscus]|uniref:hypothetical protein n=1 Tax=Streptomyces griseofuscus TaxID=146922 RepID=UPI0005665CFD|nr:hypothetical protein [Streptomyces griseofuscus]
MLPLEISFTSETFTAVSKDSGTAEDVTRFRISFDLPTVKGAKAEASGVDVIAQDGKTYLNSVGDQFLAAGTSGRSPCRATRLICRVSTPSTA